MASFLQAMVNSHLSEMEQVLKEMKRRTDGLESPLEMGENPYTITLDPTLTCDQACVFPQLHFRVEMGQVPLERDINIAVNGSFWVEVANTEHPFTAMLIPRSRGTCLNEVSASRV